jgi:hypothetical protein
MKRLAPSSTSASLNDVKYLDSCEAAVSSDSLLLLTRSFPLYPKKPLFASLVGALALVRIMQ